MAAAVVAQERKGERGAAVAVPAIPSTGEFTPALAEFSGSQAGLAPSVITKLTAQWQDEHRAHMARDLSDRDYVYVWVDGVHFNVRLAEGLCCLVLVGVRLDGTKELVTIGDGYRESTESRADLLLDLMRRDMRAPVVAVGDGALGFWAALHEVWPETREQCEWVHKVASVLDALPRSAQPTAKKTLAEIRDAEGRNQSVAAAKHFDAEFRPKWPKAADKVRDDFDRLLTSYDLPRRALAAPEEFEPDRVDVLDRAATHDGHQGPGAKALAWRWPSGSSSPPRTAGGPSTGHTSSPSCAPAPRSGRGMLIENNPVEDRVAA
jgi:hypothetical protein